MSLRYAVLSRSKWREQNVARLMRVLSILLSLGLPAALLGGCATQNGARVAVDSAAIDQLAGDRLIVPGQRVGLMSIGESIDDVIAAIGAPDDTGTLTITHGQPGLQEVYQKRIWGRYGLSAFYPESDVYGRIVAIAVFSPIWKTSSGINSSMSFGQAVQGLPLLPGPEGSSCSIAGEYIAPAQCFAVSSNGILLRSVNRDSVPFSFLVIDNGLVARYGGGF